MVIPADFWQPAGRLGEGQALLLKEVVLGAVCWIWGVCHPIGGAVNWLRFGKSRSRSTRCGQLGWSPVLGRLSSGYD